MGALSAQLGASMLGAVMSSVVLELLRASGETEDTIGEIMSRYALVGDDWDDDDEFEGSIGEEYEIFGEDDDDVLDELISGAGDTDIIGATPAQKRAAAKRKAAVKKLAYRKAAAVVKRKLSSRRRNPLGFVPTSIGAGVTLQVPSSPQNLFRPERLVIPSDIAFDFGVTDIKVGNVSQLVQSAELPAAIFTEVAIDTDVNWDTAEIGNQVSLSLRNKTAGAVEFTGALLGTIAKR